MNQSIVKMVSFMKAIIVRKPKDLFRLKYKTGIIFGINMKDSK